MESFTLFHVTISNNKKKIEIIFLSSFINIDK